MIYQQDNCIQNHPPGMPEPHDPPKKKKKTVIQNAKTSLAHESHTNDSVEALSPVFFKLSVQTHRPSDGATALSLSRSNLSDDSG